MDKNLTRWIKASIAQHFAVVQHAMSIEGDDRKNTNALTRFELRINGPRYKELAKDQFFVQLEINCLCIATVTSDMYLIDRVVGDVHEQMKGPIQIKKYGDNQQIDTKEYIGCLQLRSDVEDPIDITPFGKQAPEAKQLILTAIDGYFKMDL